MNVLEAANLPVLLAGLRYGCGRHRATESAPSTERACISAALEFEFALPMEGFVQQHRSRMCLSCVLNRSARP